MNYPTPVPTSASPSAPILETPQVPTEPVKLIPYNQLTDRNIPLVIIATIILVSLLVVSNIVTCFWMLSVISLVGASVLAGLVVLREYKLE